MCGDVFLLSRAQGSCNILDLRGICILQVEKGDKVATRINAHSAATRVTSVSVEPPELHMLFCSKGYCYLYSTLL
jgi:hypothetical protein